MMESSEQPTYDSSLETKDLSLKDEQIVTSYEDYAGQCLAVSQGDDDQGGGQVIGYIEVQPSDTENDTTFILPPGIEFGGQQLILHQGAEGNEYIVVYSADQDQPLEDTFTQGSIIHPGIALEADELKVDSPQMGYTETVEISHDIEKEGDATAEEDSKLEYVDSENNYHSESMEEVDGKEMAFNPTQAPSTVLLPSEENKHGKLLHLAVIAHELQSAAGDIKSSPVVENDQNSDNSRDEESVIVSQHCDDTASQANKDSHSDLTTGKKVPEVKKPVHKNVSTYSRFSSARTLGNAVSVIHTTSSTYTYDPNLRKSIESDYVSRVREEVTVTEDAMESSVVDEQVDSLPGTDHSPVNDDETDLSIQEDNEPLPMSIANELIAEHSNDHLGMNAHKELHIQEDNEHLHMNIDNEMSIQESSECLPLSEDNELSTQEDSEHVPMNVYNELSIPQDEESLSVNVDSISVEENSLSQTDGLDLTKESDKIPSCSDNVSIESQEHSNNFGIVGSLYNKQDTSFPDEKEMSVDAGEINDKNCTEDEEELKEDNNLKTMEVHLENSNKRKSSDTEFSDTVGDADTGLVFTPGVRSYSTANVKKLRLLKDNTDHSQDSDSVDKNYERRSKRLPPKTRFQSSFRSKRLLSKKDDSKTVDLDLTVQCANTSITKQLDAYEFEDSSSMKEELASSRTSESKPSIEKFRKAAKPADSLTVITEAQKLSFKGALQNVVPNEIYSDSYVEADRGSKRSSRNSKAGTKQVSSMSYGNSIKSGESCFEGTEDFTDDCKGPENQEKNGTDHEVPVSLQNNENGKTFTKTEGIACDQMPAESSINKDASDFPNSDEIIVKPPKKTYVRQKKLNTQQNDKEKIELFSSDDLSNTKETLGREENEKNASVSGQVAELENDDSVDFVASDIKSRVSATYKYSRKRKSIPPVVREMRTQSLRPRPPQPAEEEITDNPTTLDETEEASESMVNWGDILMQTSFVSTPEEEDIQPTEPPSTESFTSSPETSTSANNNSARQRQKPTYFTNENSKKSSGQTFDKLISKPGKMHKAVKTISDKKKVSKKVKKMVKSRLLASPIRAKQVKFKVPHPPSKLKQLKMAGIKILGITDQDLEDSSELGSTSATQKKLEYSCSNCNFGSNKVNNLIMHLKFCSNSSQVIDYTVNDMAKRQKIRGEDACESTRSRKVTTIWDLSNGSITKHAAGSDMPCSSTSRQHTIPDDDANAIKAMATKKKFGFAEKDIVWAKKKNRFWPAIVWKLGKRWVYLYLITSPTTSEGMKVSVKTMNTCVHSFNDVEWNKKILEKAKRQADKSNFFKVVQKSDSYVRKKFLEEGDINPKDFFTIVEKDDFVSADSSDESFAGEIDDEDSIIDIVSSGRTEEMNNIESEEDVQKIMECIFNKDCDNHVLDVFNLKIESERHKMHTDTNRTTANHLKDMSWFAPFKRDSELQLRLLEHFYDLFKSEIGEKDDLTSYVYEVWIPEAIIKAMSLVKNISIEKAEDVFFKQGTRTVNSDYSENTDDVHEP